MEPQPDSTVEPSKDKQESSDPKRAPGRDEAAGGKNSVSSGLPSGPSAKKGVHVKASLSEEKGGGSSSTGISRKVSSQKTDRGAQGDAPLDLKVRNREGGWHTLLPSRSACSSFLSSMPKWSTGSCTCSVT